MKLSEITNGISAERLLEICEAERKKKLVVLPDINIGDTVYKPYHSDYGEHWVYSETIAGYQVFEDNVARPCFDTIDEGLGIIGEFYITEKDAVRIAKERADKAPKRGQKRGGGVSLEKMNGMLASMYAKVITEQISTPRLIINQDK